MYSEEVVRNPETYACKSVNLCRLTEDTETEIRKVKDNEEVTVVYKMKASTRTHVETPASKTK